MKLRRSGSQKFHGWTNLFDGKKPRISWNEKQNQLTLKIRGVADVNTTSTYDYEVTLDVRDLAQILDVLSKDGLQKSSATISEGLNNTTHSLLRLLLSTSGMIPGQNDPNNEINNS